MQALKAIDSIIFDLDGTQWDATIPVWQSWNKALEEYAHKHGLQVAQITLEQIKSVMGLQIPEIGEKLLPFFPEEVRGQIMERGGEIEIAYLRERGGTLYPQVEETLATLAQRYKLFIVSNCQEGYIEAFLSAHKLEKYFIDYENPGRTGLSKGENIQLLIKRNQLKNPVYVGDTAGDAQAAQMAGIPFIFARYGFGMVEKYAQVIDCFSELPDILR